MKLILKEMSLRNFKGIRNQSFEFNEKETFIHGKNGSGKTSLYDAYLWCLFGKDHNGKSDHELKTYDKNGKTIPKLTCEVEVVFSHETQSFKLKRTYGENWVKPKTEPEEVFKGNFSEYFINDLLVKKSEYDEYIHTLIDENVFRAITNTDYFTSLSKDVQRSLLFKMCGEIHNEFVVNGNKEYAELLNDLNGVSFDTFKKDISQKKSKINAELKDIPARLDELGRNIPEVPDLTKIEKEIAANNQKVAEIETQLSDARKNSEATNKIIGEIYQQINELELAGMKLLHNGSREKNEKISALNLSIQKLEFEQTSQENVRKNRLAKLEEAKKEKERLEIQFSELVSEWKSINAEKLEFHDNDFTCPTCNRLFDIGDIDAKQAEMKSNFNLNKANKLAKNNERGIEIKRKIEELDKVVPEEENPIDFDTQISDLKKQLDQLSNEEDKGKEQPEYVSNLEKIEALRKSIPEAVAVSTDLNIERAELLRKNDELKEKISLKAVVENTNIRISQLTELSKKLNQELADLEKKEFLLKNFEFAKNQLYEKRINEMFNLVKFNLFHTQVDGQVIPNCECTVNGVPYSTQNNAMQIAMGLDIVNTFSEYYEMYAPIFIDNRESVTEIPDVSSQIINLVVDPMFEKLATVNHSETADLFTQKVITK